MGINYKELVSVIEKIAPKDLAESWDNCGIQVDAGREKIDKVLIALELSFAVLEEAKAQAVDMIITHHPVLFSGIKSVEKNTVIGGYLFQLIENKITVYSAHTSFDFVTGGNNDYFAKILGLSQIRNFPGNSSEAHMGRMGELERPYTLKELKQKVKDTLKIPMELSSVGVVNQKITTVGLCTGAGSDFMELALESGCQAFITGDVKHHQALWAKEAGLAVIDAGHYGTESIFIENFSTLLAEQVLDSVEIIQSKINTNPFH